MIPLLVKFWQPALIVLLLGVGVQQCHARDSALQEKGRALERVRVADSTLRHLKPVLARAETLILRDTLRVRVAVDRVVTLRDTVLKHLTDTVLVRTFVERADSTVRACNDLVSDCQRFRVTANATIAALTEKVKALPVASQRSCAVPSLSSAVVGAVIGGVTGVYLTRR